MSIVNALNNAISGLTAASRGTEVVSSNLANALTPGYARRELELSPRILAGNGGGVHIDGVARIVSDSVVADLRVASAEYASSSLSRSFFTSVETAYGLPTDGNSLSSKLTVLESALVSAATRPDSEVRLRAVADSARTVATKINSIGDKIQEARTDADRKIDDAVDVLNNSLNEVARLNRQVIVERANGRDPSSLIDARQTVIDRISEIVPVREMPRDNGRVALFSTSGAVLLDGKTPTQFDFDPTGRLSPAIDTNSIQLGRLQINGEVATDVQMEMLAGGSLEQLFTIRDVDGIKAQEQIDALARELHDRFADPSVDPTLAAGVSGIFTDGSSSFDPANERGFAQRIKVNDAVDPQQGGDLWRIRDGIAAAAEGEVGQSSILNGLAQAINDIRAYGSSNSVGGQGSLTSLADATLSDVSASRLASESRFGHDEALRQSLQQALFKDGVDTDREMEMLLHLEKAYAANAKVIQAVDAMLEDILRI